MTGVHQAATTPELLLAGFVLLWVYGMVRLYISFKPRPAVLPTEANGPLEADPDPVPHPWVTYDPSRPPGSLQRAPIEALVQSPFLGGSVAGIPTTIAHGPMPPANPLETKL